MLRVLGLSPVEQGLYEALLGAPPLTDAEVTELAAAHGWADHSGPALDRLRQLDLVVRIDTDPPRHVATPPDTAVRALLATRRGELARARQRAAALSTRFRGGRSSDTDSPMVEVIRGRPAMTRWLTDFAGDIRHELIGFDTPPYLGAPGMGNILPSAGPMHTVAYRIVFAHDAMSVPGRVTEMAERLPRRPDQQARVADVPVKMFIADRRVAVLPADHVTSPVEALLVIRHRGLLDVLMLLFEVYWARALPVYVRDGQASVGGPAELSDAHRELLPLLVAGFTDKAIGATLGWADRTVRRRLHDLFTLLDADTRFQAGYQAVARGWVDPGTEP